MFTIRPVEGAHKQFNSSANLPAERNGNFLLVFKTAAVEFRERLLRRAIEETLHPKQVAESAQRETLFKPKLGAPFGGAGGLLPFRVDQRPTLAIGDQAQRDASANQQFRHPGHAGGIPGCARWTPIRLLIWRQDLNQNARCVAIHQHQVRPQCFLMLGNGNGEGLRNCVVLGDHLVRPTERFPQDGANPHVFARRYEGHDALSGAPPFVVGFAEIGRRRRVIFHQSLREDFFIDGQADERAGDLDELEELRVFFCRAHRFVYTFAPLIISVPPGRGTSRPRETDEARDWRSVSGWYRSPGQGRREFAADGP